MPNTFKIVLKCWQFAKSGHTDWKAKNPAIYLRESLSELSERRSLISTQKCEVKIIFLEEDDSDFRIGRQMSLFLFLNLSFLLYLLKPITSFPLYLWVLYFICFILLYLILLISLFHYIYRILLYLSHSTVSFFFLLFLSLATLSI